MIKLNLDEIRNKWLNQCGPCDYGMPDCTHPESDYRPVMLRLVEEIDRLRALHDDQRQVIAEQSAEIGRLRERLDAQIHETERAEAEMSALVAAELAALPHVAASRTEPEETP